MRGVHETQESRKRGRESSDRTTISDQIGSGGVESKSPGAKNGIIGFQTQDHGAEWIDQRSCHSLTNSEDWSSDDSAPSNSGGKTLQNPMPAHPQKVQTDSLTSADRRANRLNVRGRCSYELRQAASLTGGRLVIASRRFRDRLSIS